MHIVQRVEKDKRQSSFEKNGNLRTSDRKKDH